jgi:prophage regulatory protein
MPQTNLSPHGRAPLTPAELEQSMRFMRLTEVVRVTGLRKTTIYQLQSDGQFPQRVRITANCVGWVESEVQAWLRERACKRAPALRTNTQTSTSRTGAPATR